MIEAVKNGKPGSAMMAFSKVLSDQEIAAVVYFIRQAFMLNSVKNTRYHSRENGWVNHEKYRDAYPFVSGEIPLSRDINTLTPSQRLGRALYLSACISCHDQINTPQPKEIWQPYPLSWPRNGVGPKDILNTDATSGASPYALHERIQPYQPATPQQALGQQIFQANCVLCHARDGSGKNWIGQFLEPHPRNFVQAGLRENYSRQSLMESIANGVEGTAMPAWRYVLRDQEIVAVVEYLLDRFK